MTELVESVIKSLISLNRNPDDLDWIVEAICPAPSLDEGFYATIGCFKNYDEANTYCINLTENYAHEFIYFRVKKIRTFTNFINREKTITLTTDKEFNKNLLKQKEEEEAEKIKIDIKNKMLEDFANEEKEENSLAKTGQLIYNCFKCNQTFEKCNKEIPECRKRYDIYSKKLKSLFELNPEYRESWKVYMKNTLSIAGELGLYNNLVEFFDSKEL